MLENASTALPPRQTRHVLSASSLSVLAVALGAALLLAACGPASSSTTTGAPAAQGSAAAGGEPNAANGEAAATTYTNSRFNYRVDAPGAMTEAADGSAAYLGAAERLEIAVVKDAGAADPHQRAVDDLVVLASTKPSYKVIDSLTRVTISGRSVEKIVYSWTDGVSAVTGKPNDFVSVRYYIAKDRGTLAVVNYSIAANQYDPQGADDVVSTFKWL